MIKNVLKMNGLKNTESRKLILEYLEQAKEPMTADAIFVHIREKHELNFSTVYRTLSILAEKNIILKNIGGDGISYYQINDDKHNHYLICSKCRKRIAIDGCPLEEMETNLEKKTGFNIKSHNLEFIGECPECSNINKCK